MKKIALQNINIFPFLKHIVLQKYPITGIATGGLMTLNRANFMKQYLDGSKK